MRWTQAQLDAYLNKNKSNIPATNEDSKVVAREERRKFREHVKTDGYVFCDSFYMEGQGPDGRNN